MKLGCCTWSHHRLFTSGHFTIDSWLEYAARELGVGGVDLIAKHVPDQRPAALKRVKRHATDLGLTIVIFSAENNFGRVSAAEHQVELDKVLQAIDAAYVLGAPLVRVFAGWPETSHDALWPQMIEALQACAGPADEAGVVLAVEPHNDGGFVDSSQTITQLLQDVDRDCVQHNLDPQGFVNDPDLYQAIKTMMPRTPNVVAKINQLRTDGESADYDYGRIMQILVETEYRGFVTLECEGEEDELAAAPRCIEMLRRHALTAGLV